jgi:hypothetical protein
VANYLRLYFLCGLLHGYVQDIWFSGIRRGYTDSQQGDLINLLVFF